MSGRREAVNGYAELFFGAYRSQNIEKNLQALRRLSKTISFLPLEEDAQELFGKIKADLQKQGNTLEDSDILIAATAIATPPYLDHQQQQTLLSHTRPAHRELARTKRLAAPPIAPT
jgi:hypothetical protein